MLVDGSLHQLQKFIFIDIFADGQFGLGFDRTRFRVDFLAGRKTSYRTGDFGSFENDVFPTALRGFDSRRDTCRTAADDHNIEPLAVTVGILVLDDSRLVHLLDHFATLIRRDLHQRKSRHVANDVDAFDTRFVPAVNDRKNFLRWNRGEVTPAFHFRRRLGC